jgi:hypothetical protein
MHSNLLVIHPPICHRFVTSPPPQVAKDSSGKGNDLILAMPPQRGDAEIKRGDGVLHTGGWGFRVVGSSVCLVFV